MKKIVLLSVCASLLLCLTAVVQAETIKLTESDSGRTIEMKIRDSLMIVIAGNPTTGYLWEAASNVSPILRQSNRPQFKPQSRMIGAGGEYTFCYQAVARGSRELKLVYRRPWEKKPPLKIFQVKVNVKK